MLKRQLIDRRSVLFDRVAPDSRIFSAVAITPIPIRSESKQGAIVKTHFQRGKSIYHHIFIYLSQLTFTVNLTHWYYKHKSCIRLLQVSDNGLGSLDNRIDLNLAFNYGK